MRNIEEIEGLPERCRVWNEDRQSGKLMRVCPTILMVQNHSEAKFDEINNQFAEAYNKLKEIDNKFTEIDKKLTVVDGKLDYVQIISDVVQGQATSIEELWRENSLLREKNHELSDKFDSHSKLVCAIFDSMNLQGEAQEMYGRLCPEYGHDAL